MFQLLYFFFFYKVRVSSKLDKVNNNKYDNTRHFHTNIKGTKKNANLLTFRQIMLRCSYSANYATEGHIFINSHNIFRYTNCRTRYRNVLFIFQFINWKIYARAFTSIMVGIRADNRIVGS